MARTFLIADTHWGHKGVCEFLTSKGDKLRPWDTYEEMDAAMIDLWNKTVGPKDKVYVLGDWVINRRALGVGSKLNGDKILIKGNHDIFRLHEYVNEGFRDIRGYHVMDGMILSHIPVHENELNRFGVNIHGHLHSNRVMNKTLVDVRYHCVSVEHNNFKPIDLEEVKANILAEGGSISFRKRDNVVVG